MKSSVLAVLGALALTTAPSFAQHAQVSSVAVHPNDANEVWVCNRGNASVSVIDTAAGVVTHEIAVGVWPRSIAFSPDGSLVLVANQRGNVAVDAHFVTPFGGGELRGTITVINAASKTVVQLLTGVGTEPYGVAFAPNGEYFAVSGQRSGTLKLYDASTFTLSQTLEYPHSMSFIASGTVLDVDSNVDMLPDLAEPRAFVIRDDSSRIYVTHPTGGFVSAVDVQLDAAGKPTGVSLASRIDLNEYAPHPIFNPVHVQTVKSQGTPRFLDDVALSPDGSRALVPHLLHNVNHDVSHTFVPAIDGDFANRVYPAVTVVDAVLDSYGQPGDASARLHHELTDPSSPAVYVPYGGQGATSGSGIYTLGGVGAPIPGGTAGYIITGMEEVFAAFLAFGNPVSVDLGPLGTLLNLGDFGVFPMTAGAFSAPIPANPALEGQSFFFQAAVVNPAGPVLTGFSNGVEMVVGASGPGAGKLGHRAGHPSRVLLNADGDHAVLLNQGSEDVFLYGVNGSTLTLETVFPPRHDHVERAPFDTSTPLGDFPLGMALAADPATKNDDALLYVVNEATRTMSTLRIDWDTGVITQEAPQIPILLMPDAMTASERAGQELFHDASRAQTAGGFNNSCNSCHFEGTQDGNVWQRESGPRSTKPVFGGSLLTGLHLWKGVRLNLGESGPMFQSENGGTGVLSVAEQQALIDYHRIIPVPLNPHLDSAGGLSALAAVGRDLFFGLNDTGTNPTLRHGGCAACHPDMDPFTQEASGYTTDFLNPLLTDDPAGLETFDPFCISLQENLVAPNIRDVNSGVNVDVDGDGSPDPDRNADGWSDLETYVPLNADADFDFTRDDDNGYPCPLGGVPGAPKKLFLRDMRLFSVPTALGSFATGPYFHDNGAASLRLLLDPGAQQVDPTYGNPAYPGLQKHYNEFHDVVGHEQFVPGASKVQATLQTIASGSTFQADIEALLAFVASI